MGQAKNELIDRMDKERLCGECGSTVEVNWETSSYYCENCKENYSQVIQCAECENMISAENEISICVDCEERHLKG